jgi:hypothetical protein
MEGQWLRIRLPAVGDTPLQTVMRTLPRTLGILAVSLLTFVGCGGADSSGDATGEVHTIDATRFRPAFATAAPEVKEAVDKVMTSIQASMYADALTGLDKLADTPNLTEPQKKVVAKLTEQMKKKVASFAPRPSR